MAEDPRRAAAAAQPDWRNVRREILLRVARRILQDEHEAEDVVQDTLARVWERAAELKPRRLHGYLAKAVEINSLNRRARRRSAFSLDVIGQNALRAPEPDDPPDDFAIDAGTLERALLGLPPVQQAVLRMKFYVGLSFREIGFALAISQNTAASRYRYAIAALREALSDARNPKGDT